MISSNLTVSSRYKAVSLLEAGVFLRAGAITVQTVACCRYFLRHPQINPASSASIRRVGCREFHSERFHNEGFHNARFQYELLMQNLNVPSRSRLLDVSSRRSPFESLFGFVPPALATSTRATAPRRCVVGDLARCASALARPTVTGAKIRKTPIHPVSRLYIHKAPFT